MAGSCLSWAIRQARQAALGWERAGLLAASVGGQKSVCLHRLLFRGLLSKRKLMCRGA